MNAKLIDDLNERINAFLRNTPAADAQKNLKALLTQAFTKMDLVTREEFDIQSQVLARTREKLTTLEARLAEIEKRGAAQGSA
jgi:BMFP domain-containing protein YqiC